MESSIKYLFIYVLMIWGLGLGAGGVKAQTTAEFLQQKKTQEKYLLKQLAYLELYGAEIRKGYQLAKQGLGTIKGFTSGEFKLHEAFFDALSTVSSVIKKDYRVGEIASMQLQIRASLRELAGTSALTPATKNYVEEVRKNVIEECNQDLEELLDIVLSSEVEMDDQERLARLKVVYESMSMKAEFTMYFCAQVSGQLLNQKGYKIDIDQIRRLYDKY